ncbi:uncharacterized protein AB675_7040 [Cyphellophora attinorum]|uniref:Uncharacterized protein n=1 Tax=Cyphellophora attinorum TaxID=1664694 RepID=A0A0N0NPU2_9EURO|nr:uncharacterized protein AB675_7040 [Phialophora attinorum]KPI43151.1 hypothetical protein AB675_7040 [Phialophora attinorum]
MARVHSQLLWRSQQYVHPESDFLGPCLGKSGQPLLCTPRPPRSGFGGIQESAVPLGSSEHTQANTLFTFYDVNQRLAVEVVLSDDERRTGIREEDKVCQAVHDQRGIHLKFVSRIDHEMTAETSATQFAQSTIQVWPTRIEPFFSSNSFQESPTESGSDTEFPLTHSTDMRPVTRPRRAETRNQRLPSELINKVLCQTCLCWSAEQIEPWRRSATERRFVPVDAAFGPSGLLLAFEHHCDARHHRKLLFDFISQERRMGRSILGSAKTLWYVSFDPSFGFEGMERRDGSLATPRGPSYGLHHNYKKRKREAELDGDNEQDVIPNAHGRQRDGETRRTQRKETPDTLHYGEKSSPRADPPQPALSTPTAQEPLIWKEDAMYLQLRKGWWLR